MVNNWVYLLKMGGSFHGELLVITRGYLRDPWIDTLDLENLGDPYLSGYFSGNHLYDQKCQKDI
jgi:hypothetical protein